MNRAAWLLGIGPKLIVHRLVAHEAVGQRDEYRLQQAMASSQGLGGDAGLLVPQQYGAGMDERTCALATQGRGRDFDVGVVTQALGLPCLVVRAEERRSPSKAMLTGVSTGVPSRLYVVRRIVFASLTAPRLLLTASPSLCRPSL